MITSNNTNFVPIKKNNQTEMTYLKQLKSLHGIPGRGKQRTHTKKITRRIGHDVFRVMARDNTINGYITSYQDQIDKHGTLLIGPLNGIGLLRHIRREKIKELL